MKDYETEAINLLTHLYTILVFARVFCNDLDSREVLRFMDDNDIYIVEDAVVLYMAKKINDNKAKKIT